MTSLLAEASGSNRSIKMLDVAAAAGVSRTTVSNVMRGDGRVDDSIRERVLAAAESLGYVYNRGAASLRMKQSHLIGLVVPDLGNPFIAEAIRGIQAVLRVSGYMVVTTSTRDLSEEQSATLRSLGEHRVDGFLMIPAIESRLDDVKRDLGGLPAVLINRDLQGSDLPYVGPDEAAVGIIAARHLVEHHGCRRVAYFGGPAAASPRIQRAASFDATVRSFGSATVRNWCIATEPTERAAYEAATVLLRSAEIPDGIHCHSDIVAYGVLRALREAKIAPDECRVIGTDDLGMSDFVTPRLTSISVDAYDIGRMAARRLLEQLNENPLAEVQPPRLHVRESCGCTADDEGD